MGSAGARGKLWQPTREDLIVWGIAGLTVFFIALSALDGVIFYHSIIDQKNFPEPQYESIGISVSQIDEAVKKLDERRTKFNEALSK